MRGRFQAITVSAVCAALCLLLPPLSYISGAVIGLVTLRNGLLEGAYVIAGVPEKAEAPGWRRSSLDGEAYLQQASGEELSNRLQSEVEIAYG